MKRARKYREAAALRDREAAYSVTDAVGLIKRMSAAKFAETVEISARLGVNPRHADQMVRGTVVLPYGTGRSVRVLALVKDENAEAARAAGADRVGAEEYLEKIQGGWADVDVIVTTPDMMKEVGRLGKILGPRGLMPNPKSGTVTPDKPMPACAVYVQTKLKATNHCAAFDVSAACAGFLISVS